MTMNKSSRWSRLRALAAVPVIALALLAFANPSIDAAVAVNETASVSQDKSVQSPTSQPSKTEVAPVTIDDNKKSDGKIYRSCEQMPDFPGGIEALIRYLSENIQYPPEAAKNKIEGRVIIQFVVEKTGEVGEVKVVRPISEELDAEAVRVVKTLPKFEPGRQDGEAVAVWYTLPVSFKLQGDPEPTDK